ncbi:MAG TPA: hypothetical protein VH482_01545 [Thermomicrobiales bacterium]|jgi:hypothetical protein
MYHNARALQRAFEDRQSEVLRTIGDCGHLAPGVLAARERLQSEIDRKALLLNAGPKPAPQPGRFRHWCGALAIRLGGWLGGDPLALNTKLPTTSRTEPRLP